MPLIHVLIVLGLALIAAPPALQGVGHPLDTVPFAATMGLGVILFGFGSFMGILSKLYWRASADEAFVRTGWGGPQIVRDGGAIVIPFLHEITRVSLATIKLEVERRGEDALITQDKLRADLRAEFFVRVQPESKAIQSAARSLGSKMTEDLNRRGTSKESAVKALVEDKLVSALRTGSAQKTLEQLNSDREDFLRAVTEMVKQDLEHNGFILESVTISRLDQTDVQFLKESNIFDAQGMRTIAQITEANLTQTNEIKRNAEQRRKEQDVKTRQEILELERSREEAEATQATQVATIQADQRRISQEKQIEAERKVQEAQVEQARAVQVAKEAQNRSVAVAEQERIKAVTEAQRDVEVAKRAQEQAIATAEAARAVAEAKLAEAEAERQKARQQVMTVEAVEAAERKKQEQVIAATAAAEQAYVTDSKKADAEAYQVEAQAKARKASADADAEATRKQAEANAEATRLVAEGNKAAALAEAEANQAKLEAEAAGRRAVEMIPVDVKAREVEVERDRVENVVKPELEAREKHGKVAQEFEISKLKIEAEKEVRVQTAGAMAQVYGKIEAHVFGTPEDAANMGGAFAKGLNAANLFGGFVEAASNNSDLSALGQQISKLATKALAPAGEKNGNPSTQNNPSPDA